MREIWHKSINPQQAEIELKGDMKHYCISKLHSCAQCIWVEKQHLRPWHKTARWVAGLDRNFRSPRPDTGHYTPWGHSCWVVATEMVPMTMPHSWLWAQLGFLLGWKSPRLIWTDANGAGEDCVSPPLTGGDALRTDLGTQPASLSGRRSGAASRVISFEAERLLLLPQLSWAALPPLWAYPTSAILCMTAETPHPTGQKNISTQPSLNIRTQENFIQ